jgi:hypothetical protein
MRFLANHDIALLVVLMALLLVNTVALLQIQTAPLYGHHRSAEALSESMGSLG